MSWVEVVQMPVQASHSHNVAEVVRTVMETPEGVDGRMHGMHVLVLPDL